MPAIFLLFALSVVVAILFNYGSPKFAATSVGQKLVGSYLGATLSTAVVFFLAIYGAALILGAVGAEPRRLP